MISGRQFKLCLLAIFRKRDTKYQKYVHFVHANPCAHIVLSVAIKSGSCCDYVLETISIFILYIFSFQYIYYDLMIPFPVQYVF